MVRHRGESSKMGQAGPLLQAAAGGLQVQTRLQTAGAAYEERDSNKTSMKLVILHKGRRRHLERQPGRRATKRDLHWRKPTSMFLKRAWRNSTKAKEGYLG
ncbi:hypothetical protein BHM03_00014676 [Ensete ventricosum]|uniref:Uncharacterized protein n=1 Tax=Ensete ventricosum TaxID=4639 RepID=A0A445MED6_ENSVE|nr:hypothetical protein BHM03_00014676 [Ensete ventricosum]